MSKDQHLVSSLDTPLSVPRCESRNQKDNSNTPIIINFENNVKDDHQSLYEENYEVEFPDGSDFPNDLPNDFPNDGVQFEEDQDLPPSAKIASETPAMTWMGRGRLKIVKTGQKGRPRKQFHMVETKTVKKAKLIYKETENPSVREASTRSYEKEW